MASRKRKGDAGHDATVRAKYPRLPLSPCKGPNPESDEKEKPRKIPELLKTYFQELGPDSSSCSEFVLGYLLAHKAVQRNIQFPSALEQLQNDPICTEGVASVAVFENGFWKLRADLPTHDVIHIDMMEEEGPPLLEESAEKQKERKLDTALFELSVAKQQKQEAVEKVKMMEEDLCHARNHADMYKAQAAYSHDDETKLCKELEIASAEKDKFYALWKRADEEREALEEKSGRLFNALIDLGRECEESKKALDAEKKQHDASVDLVQQLSRQLQAQRDAPALGPTAEQLFKATNEFLAMEKERDELKNTLSIVENRCNELGHRLKASEDRCNELRDAAATVDMRCNAALEKAKHEVAQYKFRAEAAEVIAQKLREEIAEIKTANPDVAQELLNLRKQFRAYEKEARADLATAQNERDDYKSKWEHSEMLYDSVCTRYDELESKMKQVSEPQEIQDKLGLELRAAATNETARKDALLLFRGPDEDGNPGVWVGKVLEEFKKSVKVQWYAEDNDTIYRLLSKDESKPVSIDAIFIIGQVEALPNTFADRAAFQQYVMEHSVFFRAQA